MMTYTLTGADIAVDGDVVVKVHRPGTDPHDLATRLRLASDLVDGPLLAPLRTDPERFGSRWRTYWPRVEPAASDSESWAAAGRLLAALHRIPVDEHMRSLQHGAPQRLRRAVYGLRRHEPVVEITRAASALPHASWMPGRECRPVTLVHGGWHLGQLGRREDGTWTLFDIDDLGVGDPAWDLARPAGFWAAGLLDDDDWRAFVDAYRAAGGPAIDDSDAWPVLEPFARAAVVHAAATGVAHGRDGWKQDLLEAECARIAG